MNKLHIVSATCLLFAAGTAHAGGDTEAGAALFESVCGECHYEDDFSGESAADIAAMIKPIVDGEEEHDEDISKLSADDIANLAAYFASQ